MVFLLLSVAGQRAFAKPSPVPFGSISLAKTKLQRHFDRDHNQFINRYEYDLIRTYTHQHYPLAIKLIERVYDFDDNGMLQPFEVTVMKREVSSDQQQARLVAYKKKRREERLKAKKKNASGIFAPDTDNVVKPGFRPRF